MKRTPTHCTLALHPPVAAPGKHPLSKCIFASSSREVLGFAKYFWPGRNSRHSNLVRRWKLKAIGSVCRRRDFSTRGLGNVVAVGHKIGSPSASLGDGKEEVRVPGVDRVLLWKGNPGWSTGWIQVLDKHAPTT